LGALDSVSGVSGVIRQDASRAAVRSAWHIFPLLLDDAIDRDRFRRHLRDEAVQTSVHYPPLHLSTAFALWARNSLPLTEEFARRTVTIPLFPHMSDRQQAHVVEAVDRAAGSAA
jgi:dTDP-4-amino-4,6-dideoxygalactose transaminase